MASARARSSSAASSTRRRCRNWLPNYSAIGRAQVHYARLHYSYVPVAPLNDKIETPDKQNAEFLFEMPMKMSDEDPDYAALTIAGMIFGGSPNSRLFQRIRVKDGLSYGASAGFTIRTKDDGSFLSGGAIAAPQNMAKVEADFNQELALALKDGFTADEVEKAKKTWLDDRAQQRTEDGSIANLLAAARGLDPHHALGRKAGGRCCCVNAKAGQRRVQATRRSHRYHYRQRRRLQEIGYLPVEIAS